MDDGAFALALRRLGAGAETLTADERAALARDGFVALVGALPPELVASLLRRLDELRAAGAAHEGEPGCRRIDGLLDRDALFHAAWAQPRLLAAVHRVIGAPFQPVALNYRAALRGHGRQAFHHDAPYLGRPPNRGYAQSVIALVDFTAESGATRVVPGSHRAERFPDEALADVAADHPREVALRGPAGTIFVLDGNTWHAGGRNATATPRHSLHASWMARAVGAGPLLAQRQALPAAIADALDRDVVAVLNPPAVVRDRRVG